MRLSLFPMAVFAFSAVMTVTAPVCRAAQQRVVTVEEAEIKEAPKEDAQVLEVLKMGDRVNTSDQAKNGFYRVKTKTAMGWMSEKNFVAVKGGKKSSTHENGGSGRSSGRSDRGGLLKRVYLDGYFNAGYVRILSEGSTSTSTVSSSTTQTVTSPFIYQLTLGGSVGFHVVPDLLAIGFSSDFRFLGEPNPGTVFYDYQGYRLNLISPMVTLRLKQVVVKANFEFFGNYTMQNSVYDQTGSLPDGTTAAFQKPMGGMLSISIPSGWNGLHLGATLEYLSYGAVSVKTPSASESTVTAFTKKPAFLQVGLSTSFVF